MTSYPTSETSASGNANDETVFNSDTMIQIIKKLILFLVVYSVGYFELSTLWICAFIAVALIDSKWRERKKRRLLVARAMAMGHEKEIVSNSLKALSNSLKALPSWVKFRDVEKTEWLNRIFNQIWQQVCEYTHDLVPKIVEPAVQAYVSDFKFNHVVLGNVPLRVDGVQVYDEGEGRKIVMDLDISYVGDCYVTFQTFKVTGGIKDIQLHGRLRVVLTPLISKLPIIGGVQVYFMKPPLIDFDFFKVTSILDIPVIRSRIKSTTMKIINSMFLYPNSYSLNLREGIRMSKFALFRTEGVLRVHVVDAFDLENKDLIGKSDPYVVLEIGSIRVQTPVVQNSLNPQWDFWREFEIDVNSELRIEVWDKDEGSKDDSLGHAKIGIAEVTKIGHTDKTIALEGVSRGAVRIRLTWLSLSSSFSDLEAAIKETELLSPYLHTALLMIYLDSSSDLPMIKSSPPNPYVELQMEDLTKFSDIEQATCHPVWDKGFTFMIRDPRQAVLNLRIFHDDRKHKLGEISYHIDKLKNEEHSELRRHTFFFNKPDTEANICCSIKLRILKNEHFDQKNADGGNKTKPTKPLFKQDSNVSESSVISANSTNSEAEKSSDNDTDISGGVPISVESDLGKVKLSLHYSQQRQKLVIKLYEAVILNASNSLDLYANLFLQVDKHKSNKQKTKVVKNTNNPVFDTEFNYLISAQDLNFTFLVLQVNNEKGMFRNKILGQTVISLAKCINLTEPYTDWFQLNKKSDMDVYHLTIK